jgi:hypothetical protein
VKTILSALGLASLLIVGAAAHADSVSGSAQNQNTPTQSPASLDQGGTEAGATAYGSPNRGLTRQEVREQLIQAQNDGQLKALNAALYSRP